MKRKTTKKRMRARLQAVKERLKKIRHAPIHTQGQWLERVVAGYFRYHAIPGNIPALEAFRNQVVRHWHPSLRRRSQRHRLAWERFGPISNRYLPRPQVLHPYPNDRFYAKHPK